jgi:hypothetical protein
MHELTTIILVIVGILLAAAAAIMVVFYGGDAFNRGGLSAQASTLVNAGANVLAASELSRAETGIIGSSIPDLLVSGRLDARPTITGAVGQDAWRSVARDRGGDAVVYVATGLSRDLCERVSRSLGMSTEVGPAVSGRMGCYSPSTGNYAFYTVLNGGAAPATTIAGSFSWSGLTDETPYVYTPTGVPGMTFSGGAGLTRANSAWLFPASPDGGDLAFMQDAGSVDMDVGGLVAGAEYEVRFYVAARPKVTSDDNPDGGDDLFVSYAGQRIGSYHPVTTSFTSAVTSRFRAVEGQNSIRFHAEPSGRDQSTGFDGVQVIRVS